MSTTPSSNGVFLQPPATLNVKSGFDNHTTKNHLNGSSDSDATSKSELNVIMTLVNGKKRCENLQDYVLQVAAELGQRTSFYTLDLADVILKIQKWKKMLPDVKMFYAVKANSDSVLLRMLVLLGLSFDCATEGEIQMVLNAGAHPRNILWAHTVKTVDGLSYARSVGVDFMTFDSEEELQKIHKVYPEARLLLRLQPSLVKCQYDLSSKFGCPLDQAPDLLKQSKELHMKVEGISFHVGALCTDSDSFATTIRDSATVFKLGREIGHPFTVLDIGGGFFGASGTEDIFSEITKGINSSLRKYFPDRKGIRLIAEPGCYVVGSCMNLVCTIIGKRSVTNSEEVQMHYFVNNGIYSSFFRGVEFYGIQIKPLLNQSEISCRRKYSSILYGQTCCSEDIVGGKCCHLPELRVGECIAWENMGAYSNVLCGTFCGVPLPHTTYIFMQNQQLNMDDVRNKKGFESFLAQHAVFIGSNKGDL